MNMTNEQHNTSVPVENFDEQLHTARDYDRWLLQKSFNARWARFWFAPNRTVWLNTPVRNLARTLALKPSDKILEIGCGYAGLLLYLFRKVGFTSPMEGLDCSSLMIARACTEVRARGCEGRIRLQQGLATQLPYAD